MAQLETNHLILHREEEIWKAIRFIGEAGREINAIARNFNSGYGTADQLRHAVYLLSAVYERLCALRKKGYLHAANRKTRKVRISTRDYSRNLSVRMTEEQYQRLSNTRS